MIPPPLPPAAVYTSCYCEENVYLLTKVFLADPEVDKVWNVYVIFISNEAKSVYLWSQKAGKEPDNLVNWDYHVILVLKPRIEQNQFHDDSESDNGPQSWVYDFDSTIPMPGPWDNYVALTFPEGLPPKWESKFRVIPGHTFLQHFASDRSHMIKSRGVDGGAVVGEIISSELPTYFSPPPLYLPIQGTTALEKGIVHNLMSHYVDMLAIDEAGVYGVVHDRDGLTVDFFTV